LFSAPITNPTLMILCPHFSHHLRLDLPHILLCFQRNSSVRGTDPTQGQAQYKLQPLFPSASLSLKYALPLHACGPVVHQASRRGHGWSRGKIGLRVVGVGGSTCDLSTSSWDQGDRGAPLNSQSPSLGPSR
jgi:hypothetical protein